jgi:hypothetical protein
MAKGSILETFQKMNWLAGLKSGSKDEGKIPVRDGEGLSIASDHEYNSKSHSQEFLW